MSAADRAADRWWHGLPDERRLQIWRWIDSEGRTPSPLGPDDVPLPYEPEEPDR